MAYISVLVPWGIDVTSLSLCWINKGIQPSNDSTLYTMSFTSNNRTGTKTYPSLESRDEAYNSLLAKLSSDKIPCLETYFDCAMNVACIASIRKVGTSVDVVFLTGRTYNTVFSDEYTAKLAVDDLYNKIQEYGNAGALSYKGTWDSTNQIDFSGIPTPQAKGNVYVVTGEGCTIDGITYSSGDYLIINKPIASGEVTSADIDKLDRSEGADLVKLDATQTLTNKTIDSDDNTISNLILPNFKPSIIQTSVRNTSIATNLNLVTELGVSLALASKQDKLTAGSNIQIVGNTISATDAVYTAGSNINITGNVISATYTAGSNVQISPTGVISSTDTTYVAGSNVQIVGNTISATNTTYTAGTNVQISNGVISSTNTTYTAGNGLALTGTVFSNSKPNVQGDWTDSNTASESFIKNKPELALNPKTSVWSGSTTSLSLTTTPVQLSIPTSYINRNQGFTMASNAITCSQSGTAHIKRYASLGNDLTLDVLVALRINNTPYVVTHKLDAAGFIFSMEWIIPVQANDVITFWANSLVTTTTLNSNNIFVLAQYI